MKDFTGEIAAASAKAAPPIAVAGLTFAGLALQDWVYISTILYTTLLAAKLVVDNWGKWRDGLKSLWEKARGR